jgi:hypothetical protein
MSVVFVVSSEEQLTCGAPWCAKKASDIATRWTLRMFALLLTLALLILIWILHPFPEASSYLAPPK